MTRSGFFLNVLTFSFLLMSGFTWVAGDEKSGLSGRLTVADAIGTLIILVVLIRVAISRRATLKYPAEYRAYLPLLGVFSLGLMFAHDQQKGAFELLVHVFIYGVSLALFVGYQDATEETVSRLLKMVLYSGSALASLALVDFLFWPSLLPGVSNGLAGTFRNTGQAGAFFGVYLAITIPALLSGLVRPNLFNSLLLGVIFIALLFTVKRAAIVGCLVGIMLLSGGMVFSKSKRDKKYGMVVIVVGALLVPTAYLALQWGLDNVEGLSWRLTKKVNADTAVDFSEGFMAENIDAALAAFRINPILGVGLGNVGGIITAQLEIHSTYLALLGGSGMLGLITYGFFMSVFLARMLKARGQTACARYVRYFLPLFVGLVVSWSYTYHLRKREYWIMFFILVLVSGLARRQQVARAPAGGQASV